MNAFKRYIPFIVLIIAIIAAYISDLHHHITLENIQAQKDDFKAAIADNPLQSGAIFMGLYIAAVALSLPIASLLTLLGGFLFGLIAGTFMVVTSATIGASIIFLIAKTSFGESLRQKAGGLYKKVEDNMRDNAVGYLLFMRLVPLFPFVAVNILPALFNIPLKTFVLTTFFGILPGTTVYVYFGQQLGEIDQLSDLVRPELLLAFTLLGVFAVIPTLYKQLKDKKNHDT